MGHRDWRGWRHEGVVRRRARGAVLGLLTGLALLGLLSDGWQAAQRLWHAWRRPVAVYRRAINHGLAMAFQSLERQPQLGGLLAWVALQGVRVDRMENDWMLYGHAAPARPRLPRAAVAMARRARRLHLDAPGIDIQPQRGDTGPRRPGRTRAIVAASRGQGWGTGSSVATTGGTGRRWDTSLRPCLACPSPGLGLWKHTSASAGLPSAARPLALGVGLDVSNTGDQASSRPDLGARDWSSSRNGRQQHVTGTLSDLGQGYLDLASLRSSEVSVLSPAARGGIVVGLVHLARGTGGRIVFKSGGDTGGELVFVYPIFDANAHKR